MLEHQSETDWGWQMHGLLINTHVSPSAPSAWPRQCEAAQSVMIGLSDKLAIITSHNIVYSVAPSFLNSLFLSPLISH